MAASDSHSNADAGPLLLGASGLAFSAALLLTQGVLDAAAAGRRARNSRKLRDWAHALSVQEAVASRALDAAKYWKTRAEDAEWRAQVADAARLALARSLSARRN